MEERAGELEEEGEWWGWMDGWREGMEVREDRERMEWKGERRGEEREGVK